MRLPADPRRKERAEIERFRLVPCDVDGLDEVAVVAKRQTQAPPRDGVALCDDLELIPVLEGRLVGSPRG